MQKLLQVFLESPFVFTKAEQEIIKLLHKHSSISIYDIMKETGRTYPWVHRAINRLEKVGVVKTTKIREKTEKGRGYKVIVELNE